MSAQRACFLSQTLMDHVTGRRHNTASQKNLHRHEPNGKTTAKDRVLRSRSPGTMATCPRQSCNTTCVSSLEEIGLLCCRPAHGRHHTSTSLDRYNPTDDGKCDFKNSSKNRFWLHRHPLACLMVGRTLCCSFLVQGDPDLRWIFGKPYLSQTT